MRVRKLPEVTEEFCRSANEQGRSFVIQGIRKSFLDNHPRLSASVSASGNDNLTLVVNSGEIACLGTSAMCDQAITTVSDDATKITLQNGHLLPGLTAVTDSLGMKEIFMEEETGNGVAQVKDIKDPAYIDYAKYGVYLEGKAFVRARLGGVTRAITPPEFPSVDFLPSGLLQGVSVGIRTSGTKTLIDGGIFQDEVGLHMVIGPANMGIGSTSMAIKTVRGILTENKGKGNGSAYGLVADGKLPLIITVDSVVSHPSDRSCFIHLIVAFSAKHSTGCITQEGLPRCQYCHQWWAWSAAGEPPRANSCNVKSGKRKIRGLILLCRWQKNWLQRTSLSF